MSGSDAKLDANRRLVLLTAVGGILVFAAAAWLALLVLPEWRLGRLTDRAALAERAREVATRAGLELAETPRFRLELHPNNLEETYARLGEQAASWLAGQRRAGFLSARARLAGEAHQGEELEVVFTAGGALHGLDWHAAGRSPMASQDHQLAVELMRRLAAQLLAPGESLAPFSLAFSTSWLSVDVVGAAEPAHVWVFAIPSHVKVERNPGSAAAHRRSEEIRQFIVAAALGLPVLLAAAGLFAVLFIRSRIDLVNGFLLALVTLASADPAWIPSPEAHWFLGMVEVLASAPGKALWVFLVWSAAESLLRTAQPDFSTSLDLLRKGRVGPRAGRALLGGLGIGAALAGLQLVLYAAAVAAPWASPAGTSVDVPIFRDDGGPLGSGISLAAVVTFLLALASRFLPRRFVLAAVALAGGLFIAPVSLQPWPVELAAGAVVVGALAWLGRRQGLTALLSAAVTSFLVPAVLFSGLHRDWLMGSFVLTAAMTGGIALVGLVGLARSVEAESRWVEPPAFIRRLEQERRVQHEMKLLTEMQAGLLPKEMPRVPGWQIAARAVFAGDAGNIYDAFADDSGQLWVAAGDVAGRGYACAIAQAMIKAGLASLAEPGESPASVLADLDRVLRTVDSDRSYTTLTLVRLDPESGKAFLANAGQPPALLLAERKVREIAVTGLPLGQGPPRTYTEQAIVLQAGAALVLCSDGLLAALDAGGHAYGLSRVSEILALMDRRPALEIVDTLLNDCRRHVGHQQLPDDLTVVVVRRSGAAGGG